jgi:hypothetical protein
MPLCTVANGLVLSRWIGQDARVGTTTDRLAGFVPQSNLVVSFYLVNERSRTTRRSIKRGP